MLFESELKQQRFIKWHIKIMPLPHASGVIELASVPSEHIAEGTY
jgi:hypothetical protein